MHLAQSDTPNCVLTVKLIPPDGYIAGPCEILSVALVWMMGHAVRVQLADPLRNNSRLLTDTLRLSIRKNSLLLQ